MDQLKKAPTQMRSPWVTWPLLMLVLLATWGVYQPGLSGTFLFDDEANLSALGKYGDVDSWPAFWRYITSGFADPTGRPLALVSFLLDARTWPADPAPFLRSNVFLHILNGALLFTLLRSLGRHVDGASLRNDATALLGAGLWLLHPLFVSTTLYVVQREAMLPASFILLGLLAYVHGRNLHAARPRAGAAWVLLGIGLGTLLAVLSKANGALLPLLAWIIESTVLRAGDRPNAGVIAHRLRRWRRGLLVMPTLVLLGYLAFAMPGLHAELAGRPWTLAERLMTQPRVLLDYLQLLLVPRVLSTGLYNDTYAASTSLLSPASTLFATLAIVGLVVIAWAKRYRYPVLGGALLFYFAGHLLESTVIPLELYFEHRNYLPALLLGWPLARTVCRWQIPPRIRAMAAVGLLALLATTTWQRTTIWGQPATMARLWVAKNPDSSRAQATVANLDINTGSPARAMARLGPRWQAKPHDLQLALNYATAACYSRGLTPEEIVKLGDAIRLAPDGGQLLYSWLGQALDGVGSHRCPGIDSATVEYWLDSAFANPSVVAVAGRKQELHSIQGRIALSQNNAANALVHFNRALDAWPTPQATGMQAALMATGGHYRHALDHLDYFESLAGATPIDGKGMARIHARVLAHQGYWRRELDLLRRNLRAELASSQAALPER